MVLRGIAHPETGGYNTPSGKVTPRAAKTRSNPEAPTLGLEHRSPAHDAAAFTQHTSLEETVVSFADKPLMCRECGREFSFTAGEQEFFAQKGFTNEPGRCPECRSARKARMGSSGGGMAYDSDRGYGGDSYGGGGGGYRRGPPGMFSGPRPQGGETGPGPLP